MDSARQQLINGRSKPSIAASRFRDAFVLRAFHDLGDPDKTIPIQLTEQTVNLRLIVAAAPTP
jgi:hypothetical protein